MKIKEDYIRNIIKEEAEQYLSELGLCHSKTTGFFSKCSSGNTYSLSKKGAERGGLIRSSFREEHSQIKASW